MKEFRERNLDVLQNLEFGIVAVYRVEPSLLDIDAKDAVEALIRHYHAEEEQRTPPKMMLAERPERVFRSVQPFCEWRLGRSAFPGETSVEATEDAGLRSRQVPARDPEIDFILVPGRRSQGVSRLRQSVHAVGPRRWSSAAHRSQLHILFLVA